MSNKSMNCSVKIDQNLLKGIAVNSIILQHCKKKGNPAKNELEKEMVDLCEYILNICLHFDGFSNFEKGLLSYISSAPEETEEKLLEVFKDKKLNIELLERPSLDVLLFGYGFTSYS